MTDLLSLASKLERKDELVTRFRYRHRHLMKSLRKARRRNDRVIRKLGRAIAGLHSKTTEEEA